MQVPADGPASEVRSALDLAQRDPREAAALARRILASDPDAVTEASAKWALGLSLREVGRLEDARSTLRSAIEIATRAGNQALAADIRSTLAFTLSLLGENSSALRQMTLAEPHLRGAAAARLRMQRGLILQRMGRVDEAVDWYRRALPGIKRSGDRIAEVRLRVNRSALNVYRNELAAAAADLEAALPIAEESGQVVQVGACAHNLGFLRGRQGNTPEGLACYDRAALAYAEAGIRGGLAAVLRADRAELLLEAGLTSEAREHALAAVAALAEDGNAADLAEARLLAARALLADGAPEDAAAMAELASRSFRSQRRPRWATLARYLELQARFDLAREHGGPTESLLRRARRVTSALGEAGWTTEGLHSATMAGRIALAMGRVGTAKRILADAEEARRRGPASSRAQAWHATALLRLSDGDLHGARRAVEAGMRVVDEHRMGLGATELRAQAGILGADLAELGVQLAIARNDPSIVLAWVDRFRAVTMLQTAVTPPLSPELNRLLSELRMLSRDSAETLLHGGSSDRTAGRTASLERRVRDLSRHQRGGQTDGDHQDLGELSESLGRRRLIEYFATSSGTGAVVVADGSIGLCPLPDLDGVSELIDLARFDLHRMATGRGSEASLAAAAAGLTETGLQLQRLLLDPLEVDDGAPLVIVPTGDLHGVPWGIIPSLSGRPFAVATSAASWLRRRSRPAGRGTAFVAGPDLPGGRAEVDALAAGRSGTLLVGDEASADRVLGAIEASDVVHLAAHGEFRPDNPMFSSLSLSDGPLTVYELEHLRRVPRLFVLPACDAAVSGVRAGDELLGLAAALLRLGASTLVAPAVPVPDDATRELMLAFHERLEAGLPADEALAVAGRALEDDDPQAFAVRRSFLVLGSS